MPDGNSVMSREEGGLCGPNPQWGGCGGFCERAERGVNRPSRLAVER